MIEDLGAELVQQCFFIGAVELSYLGQLADLRAMCFDGPPIPGVLGKESGINPHLGGEKAHDLGCRLLPGTGESTFVLQAFQ